MAKIAWMDPNKIKFITIHCAATPEGRDVKADRIREIGMERFGQPSYHYVIELDGNVVQLLQPNQRGAHTGGANTGNIGICYIGGVDADDVRKAEDTRTDAQKAAMEHLLRNLLMKWPNAKVRGHRDWPGVAKACPSFSVKDWLKSVRLETYFG